MVKRASGCCCWILAIPLLLTAFGLASLVAGKGPFFWLIERVVEESYVDKLFRALEKRDVAEIKKQIAFRGGYDGDYWDKALVAALPLQNAEITQLIREKGGDATRALGCVSTVEEAKALMRMGAKADASATYGDGSLLASHVRNGNAEVVEWLLEKTPNAKAHAKDYTALVAFLKTKLHEGVSQPVAPNSERLIAILKRYGAKEPESREER